MYVCLDAQVVVTVFFYRCYTLLRTRANISITVSKLCCYMLVYKIDAMRRYAIVTYLIMHPEVNDFQAMR